MPGPQPKNPATRQRRNRAATSAVLVDTSKRRKRAPQLPRGREWDKRTRDWWRDVWASPMADEFLDVDVHGLYVLADLIDQYWRTADPKLAGEIRLQRQCYGLTPIDRRRLQWQVERDDAEPARRPKNRRHADEDEEADDRPAADDPRQMLKVVK